MPLVSSVLLTLLLLPAPQGPIVIVPIPTSDAVDLARLIAHDEGYDVTKTAVYYFEQLTGPQGAPFLEGYTSIGFYIEGNARNLIVINNSTGQAMDYNTCEIFDYADLKPFQEQTMRLSQARRKTAEELAREAGCSSPKVLTTPVSFVGPN
jgi:hypothetical protein